MPRFLAILLLLFCSASMMAERVNVRIFSNATISLLNVSFDLGTYNLYTNDTTQTDSEIGSGHSVVVKAVGNKVQITVDGHNHGTFSNARLVATDTACILCLNPKNQKQRTYEGNLVISSQNSQLRIINDVDFETYIAGVVQSEIYGKESDIYRVQAIISRTWAMRNMGKHAADGYNFCDHVHCQAYHNRCIRPEIMLGTIASSGETIVDESGNLIETPFHSNSGGQTCNSEDVWRTALPYLRSIVDTFSYGMKQSQWTKTMSADRWLSYFAKTHKLDINDSAIRDSLLHFSQPERQPRLLGIQLTKVRMDLGLKSTFFSVEYDSVKNSVTLNGRGYGHGVGLSQEGTIRMVRLGIPYDSIIHHYYTNSFIQNNNTSQDIVRSQTLAHHIGVIIEEDRQQSTQKKSKKDDWLGRLFRIRDREEREEVYDAKKQDLESDWEYEW
ncbi:MAG: SpoIID/LytB domain-containing protein [Bacteroidales bacterium]|nr:SpoIID/LytB domain-containing protein [Bacteroidales bacterium]